MTKTHVERHVFFSEKFNFAWYNEKNIMNLQMIDKERGLQWKY